MDYFLGQVIYILSTKTNTVIPAVITEEFIHKTLSGNVVSYKVLIGPKEKQEAVALNTIDGKIFTSLDDIRKVLTQHFSKLIDDLIETAEKRSLKWFPEQQNKSVKSIVKVKDENSKMDIQELLNSVEKKQNPEPATFSDNTTKEDIRKHLKQLADPGDINPEQEVSESGTITLPDGQRVKARFRGDI